jgi:hypothetical protein
MKALLVAWLYLYLCSGLSLGWAEGNGSSEDSLGGTATYYFASSDLIMAGISGNLDHQAVYCLDRAHPKPRILWRSTAETVERVWPSPTSDAVAVIHMESHPETKQRVAITLLSSQGQVISELQDAYDFSWGATARSFVYVTGQQVNGRPHCTGVWLCRDAREGRERIAETALAVQWAQHDNNVYWMNHIVGGSPRIVRFDTKSQSCEPTPHHALFFSPDGTYYYDGSNLVRPRILLTATDDVLQVDLPGCEAYRWLGTRFLALLSGRPPENYILDCGGRVLRGLVGLPIGMTADATHVFVLKPDEEVTMESLVSLHVIR